jgi:PAS domain S-box-containing protein
MMNRREAVSLRWRDLGITAKFSVAFGTLLTLIVLIAIASVVALTFVRRETETAIVTSTQIQHLVLEMDRGLEKARRLEKDFFLRYPTIGYAEAYQAYAQPADKEIAHVRALNTELQQLVAESDVSDTWKENDINLNLYFSAAGRHATTVEEAADLVARLAADETGQQTQLARNSSLLRDVLQSADDPDLLILFAEMQAFEKDYLLTRRRPLMQSAFNAAVPLREAIESAPTLSTDQKTQALAYLDGYLKAGEEIVELDVAIRGKFNEFDLQAEAVDPITQDLIELAEDEVDRASARIRQTNRLVVALLAVIALAGLGLTGVVAKALNNSVTRNIVRLTQVAGALQAGDLQVRAHIDSGDELGQLATSFNTMATRLDALVGNLERQVTERTAALQTEKERAQQYLDIAGAMFVALDRQGNITLINKRGLALLGYREEELVGRNWFETCLPAWLRGQVRGVFEQLMAGEVELVEYYENPVLTKDGDERIVAWHNAVLRDAAGGIFGTLSSGEDITERKRVEEIVQQLAKFPGENPSPVLRVTQDGTVVYANQAASPLLDVWGCQDGQLLPDEWRRFAAGVLDSDSNAEREATIGNRTLSLTFAPVVEANYVNVYGLDITKRVRAEAIRAQAEQALKEYSEHLEDMVEERTRELREAQGELILKERLATLGQLAGGVGHELRNPLGVISNAVYYLNMVLPDADETTQEYLDILSLEVRNADKIVTDLLDFARTQVPDKRKVQASALVNQALERLPLPEDVELITDTPADLPAVFADPGHVEMVLGNLIANACQAMPEGGKLTIEARLEGDQVALSVADTGCGISPENMTKLFEPLFTTKAKGIGLGLAISKSLVEANGGSIGAESEEGRGSTFTVCLPIEGGVR